MNYSTNIAIGIIIGMAIIAFVIYCIYIIKQASNGKKYLTEHFEEVKALSKKYATIAIVYIEKLKEIDSLLFTSPYDKKNLIISHYWQQKPNLLLSNIYRYDGFVNPKEKVNLILQREKAAKNLTENTISELKTKILADNSWTDKYTLPSLIYFIIRNNVIEKSALQANKFIPNGIDNYNREHVQQKQELIRQICGILQNVADNRLQEERIEQKSIEYFNKHKDYLVDKYSKSVCNFVEKITQKGYDPFVHIFKDGIPQSNILVYPYRKINSKPLRENMLKDGIEFAESTNDYMNIKIQELTKFFVDKIKNRIISNNEWEDDFTLPLLIYRIIRSGVIKYYHNVYVEKLGYDNLEEFCSFYPNATSVVAIIYYTYYKIYETDIDLPIMGTYQKICEEAQKIIEAQKQKKLENELFGKPKKKTLVVNDTPHTLSSIERIDRMTGEQFEIFMENYFKKQGFKVTRTPLSGDYGIDLIIENDFSKIGVQAKRYSDKVSLSAVQEVIGGLRHYGLSSGMVVTNSTFQSSAIQLAKDNYVTLWDRYKLIKKLGD